MRAVDRGLFLAAIKDLYTGEIVGWAMDRQMTKPLVIDALRAAKSGIVAQEAEGGMDASLGSRQPVLQLGLPRMAG